MSYRKFLQTISDSFIGRFFDRKTAIYKEIDPQRIYVETLRRYFNLPRRLVKFLCDMAVKQNLFRKKVGIQCPDCGRIIESVDNKEQIPETVKCEICEQLEHEKYVFKKTEIRTIEFYQLNKALTIE